MKTIAKASDEMLAIKEFFRDAQDGVIISYEDIEQGTGIKMTNSGKQKLRSALHSLGREYGCIRGYGIELSSPENADALVGHRLIRIDNAVKRGEKTTNRLIQKHLTAMPEHVKEKVLFVGSVFGAIRASAELARKQFKEKAINAKRIEN